MTGRRAITVIVFGLVMLPHLAAATETLTHHANYRDWQVFRLERDNLTVCYAATEASQFFPRGPTRTRPILYVVRYPKTTSKNTVEFRFGQNISSYQSVTAKLLARRKQLRNSISLSTKINTGFIARQADQTAFLKAMLKGRQIVVVSQPGVVDILEDRYSLYGATKALAKLEALCPGPQPVAPLGLNGTISGNPTAKPTSTANPPKETPK